MMNCVKCQRPLAVTANFCGKCGAVVEKTTPLPLEPLLPAQEAAQQPAALPMSLPSLELDGPQARRHKPVSGALAPAEPAVAPAPAPALVAPAADADASKPVSVNPEADVPADHDLTAEQLIQHVVHVHPPVQSPPTEHAPNAAETATVTAAVTAAVTATVTAADVADLVASGVHVVEQHAATDPLLPVVVNDPALIEKIDALQAHLVDHMQAQLGSLEPQFDSWARHGFVAEQSTLLTDQMQTLAAGVQLLEAQLNAVAAQGAALSEQSAQWVTQEQSERLAEHLTQHITQSQVNVPALLEDIQSRMQSLWAAQWVEVNREQMQALGQLQQELRSLSDKVAEGDQRWLTLAKIMSQTQPQLAMDPQQILSDGMALATQAPAVSLPKAKVPAPAWVEKAMLVGIGCLGVFTLVMAGVAGYNFFLYSDAKATASVKSKSAQGEVRKESHP